MTCDIYLGEIFTIYTTGALTGAWLRESGFIGNS